MIGSLNIDLTIRLPHFHAPGETIMGNSFNTYMGGKGGNQAVAAALLGSDVLMVGKVGKDGYGDLYRKELHAKGIDDSCVESAPETATGVALIEVDTRGDNRIAIAPGANALVDREQIDRAMPTLLQYDFFMFQLEIPMDTVCYAAERLHGHGKRVVLDPAPAVPLPDSIYRNVDYITPNAVELAMLTGMPVGSRAEAEAAGRCLIQRGAKAIIAKLGGDGCLYIGKEEAIHAHGFSVKVVDTTAAGDSFNAGLTVALASGMDIRQALRLANAAGALSATGEGAQQAMPTMEKVLQLYQDSI